MARKPAALTWLATGEEPPSLLDFGRWGPHHTFAVAGTYARVGVVETTPSEVFRLITGFTPATDDWDRAFNTREEAMRYGESLWRDYVYSLLEEDRETPRALVWLSSGEVTDENSLLWGPEFTLGTFNNDIKMAVYEFPDGTFEVRASSGPSERTPFDTVEDAKDRAQVLWAHCVLTLTDNDEN